MGTTITHAGSGDGWAIADEVIALRVWGSVDPARRWSLAQPSLTDLVVGKQPGCAIQLDDPTGGVSKRHALITRVGSTWKLKDLGSKNGCFRDGERHLEFEITPGVEIEIGSFKLIAESRELEILGAYLHRLLGFGADKRPVVDAALRNIRHAAALRSALVLRGEGDLIPIAQRLHRHAFGAARPFRVCQEADDGLAVLHDAAQGTMCVLASARPVLWSNVATAWREQTFKTRLIVCTSLGDMDDALDLIAGLGSTAAIEIPPLARRGHELRRISDEYASEAVAALGATGPNFLRRDIEWIDANVWTDIAEIEEAMIRIVAMRNWKVTAAAEKLGITHVALGNWARRRNLPT